MSLSRKEINMRKLKRTRYEMIKLDTDKIKELAKETTQEIIGEKAGIKQPYISVLLKNGRARIGTIERLAEGLGVEPEEIIHEDAYEEAEKDH